MQLFNIIKLKFAQIFDAQSKKLFKNSSWLYFSQIIRTLLMFLRSIVIARGLGPELYGNYNIIIAFVTTVQEFFNQNVGTPFIKYGAEFKINSENERFKALLKSMLLVSGITAVLSLIGVFILMVFFYHYFVKQPGFQVYIIIFAFGSLLIFFDSITISLLRLFDRFKLNSIIVIGVAFFEVLLITVILHFFPHDFHKFFLTMVLIKLIGGIITNGVAFSELKGEIKDYIKVSIYSIRDKFNEIWKFTIQNSISRTLKTLMDNGDILLLAAFSSPTQVAYYAIAKKLAFSLLLLSDPVNLAVYPQISSLVSEQRYSAILEMLKNLTRLFAIPFFIVIIVIFSFRYEILQFLYGTEYRDAANPFVFLLIGASISLIFFWNLSLLFSLGRVDIRLKTSILTILIGFFIAYLLVPQYGAAGVAFSLMISKLILTSTFVAVGILQIKAKIECKP